MEDGAGSEDLWGVDGSSAETARLARGGARTLLWTDDRTRGGTFVYALSPPAGSDRASVISLSPSTGTRVLLEFEPSALDAVPVVSHAGTHVIGVEDAAGGRKLLVSSLVDPTAPAAIGTIPRSRFPTQPPLTFPTLHWGAATFLVQGPPPGGQGSGLYRVDPLRQTMDEVELGAFRVGSWVSDADGEQALVRATLDTAEGFVYHLVESDGASKVVARYHVQSFQSGDVRLAGPDWVLRDWAARDNGLDVRGFLTSVSRDLAVTAEHDLGWFFGAEIDVLDSGAETGRAVYTYRRADSRFAPTSGLWSAPLDGSAPALPLSADVRRVEVAIVVAGRDGTAACCHRFASSAEVQLATLDRAMSGAPLAGELASAQLLVNAGFPGAALLSTRSAPTAGRTVTDFHSVEPDAAGPIVRRLSSHTAFGDGGAVELTDAKRSGSRFAYMRSQALCAVDALVAQSEIVLGVVPVGVGLPRILRVDDRGQVLLCNGPDLFVADIDKPGSLRALTGFGGAETRVFEIHRTDPLVLFSAEQGGVATLWQADPAVPGSATGILQGSGPLRVVAEF